MLDNLYDFLASHYLNTSMLSIPHEYMRLIGRDPFEIGAVAFLSALYDFQMRISLIRSRFLEIIYYLSEKGIGIFDLLDDKYFKDMLGKLLEKTSFFHRFDRSAGLFKILLRVYYETDWGSLISSMEGDIDVGIAEYINYRSVFSAPSKELAGLLNRFLSRKRSSPHKRINLFIRWMARDEYPDLGLWSSIIDKKRLLVPLGTEIARTAARVFLGRTRELPRSRRSVYLVTNILSGINPEDPIKYDFVLSRPMILGLCNKDMEYSYCWVCPLKNICKAASRIDPEHQRRVFEEKLRIMDEEKRYDRIHNIVLNKGVKYISEKYVDRLGLICSSDRSVDHGLRPDFFCNHSSPITLVAEAKTSTRAKEAPVQLKTYIDELKVRETTDKKYFAFLIFGKHDPVELNHIIESLYLTNTTHTADHIEIIIVEKEPPITINIKTKLTHGSNQDAVEQIRRLA